MAAAQPIRSGAPLGEPMVGTDFVDAAVAMAEAAWRGDINRWNEIRCLTTDRLATGFASSRLLGEMILARAHFKGVPAADAWQWVRSNRILD